MVLHHLSNHNKLHILFRVLKILITQRFQTLFRKLRKTWLVLTQLVTDVDIFSHLVVYVFVEEFSFDLVQDPALLEFAWVELLEKNKRVKVEELAEVLYFPS